MIIANSENVDDVVYKTVETEYGAVRGLMNQTILHQKSYFGFRGIPFAKPPIRELRFKPPEPADPWRPKTIDVFKYGKACSQLPYSTFRVDSSENCLFVNVFVPGKSKSDKIILTNLVSKNVSKIILSILEIEICSG